MTTYSPEELERMANWQLLDDWHWKMSRLPPGVLTGNALDVFEKVEKAVKRRRAFKSVTTARLSDLAVKVLKIIHNSGDDKLTPSKKPTAKAGKRGRKTIEELDKEIADEYYDGLENNLWSKHVEYLEAKHAKRWKENPNAAKSWFSTVLRRDTKRRKS